MSYVVHNVNCLDPAAGLPSLPDLSIDVTITDPPYESEAHTLQRRVKRPDEHQDEYGDDSSVAKIEALDFAPMDEAQRESVAKQIARVTKRWALVFCQVEASQKWAAALVAGGMTYRRTCIWTKPSAQPQLSGDRPGMGYESIVACHAQGRSTWNGGGKSGVFEFNTIGPSDARTGHQTQKPVALMEQLVRLFSDKGDLVADPYAGSGTTGVACKRNGRNFIGWEIDPKYAEIANKRIEEAKEQLTLFEAMA